MKYLYLIIRHMFPRKRCKLVATVKVNDPDTGNTFTMLHYEDQFGNLRKIKNY